MRISGPWNFTVLAAVCAAALAGQAHAQSDKPVPDAGSGFELKPFEDGYVRMNRETGAISFCKIVTGSLVCRLGAEEREAYEETLLGLEERLNSAEERLDSLEAELSASNSNRETELKKQNRLGQPDENSREGGSFEGSRNRENSEETSEEEIDKAFEFAQKAMRRFFESVKELRRDLEKENKAE
jgi:hypothetical protein